MPEDRFKNRETMGAALATSTVMGKCRHGLESCIAPHVVLGSDFQVLRIAGGNQSK